MGFEIIPQSEIFHLSVVMVRMSDGSVGMVIEGVPSLMVPSEAREYVDMLNNFYSQTTDTEIDTHNATALQRMRSAIARTPTGNITSLRLPNESSGYVYILRGIDGWFKIGKAKDVSDRTAKVGILVPFATTLILTISTNNRHGLERELHNQFAHVRGNGEWFKLTENDLAWLKSLDGAEVIDG